MSLERASDAFDQISQRSVRGKRRRLHKSAAAGKRCFPFQILVPLTCEETRMTTTRGRADWRAAGACAQADPDLFFPISSAGRALGQIAEAKAVCTACPVRQPCLEFALEHDLAYAIWGGTAPAERGGWRRARRAACPYPCGKSYFAYPGEMGAACQLGVALTSYKPEWLITKNSFPVGY